MLDILTLTYMNEKPFAQSRYVLVNVEFKIVVSGATFDILTNC